MASTTEQHNPDSGDWGWEAFGSEDEDPHDTPVGHSPIADREVDEGNSKPSSPSRKTPTEKSSPRKGTQSLKVIASSPSFQELEKAIGATIMSSHDSGEIKDGKMLSPNSSFQNSKLSSTDLTQQKVLQQRMRQQHFSHQHRHAPHGHLYNHHRNMAINNTPLSSSLDRSGNELQVQSARTELAPYINELESRAIILFHSPQTPSETVRECCSKHGVLYYIRPEFHSKGVTFLSYFDLRSAESAIASLCSELGTEASASAHYSVMLHAGNNNAEEFRLLVQHLPPTCSEADLQSIFSRYGPLRSIQKTSSAGRAGGNDTESQSSAGDNDLSYSVEYYNIQDARIAVSELSATSNQLWHHDTTVEFASLELHKQQLCRQLLATISRWRTEISNSNGIMTGFQQPTKQNASMAVSQSGTVAGALLFNPQQIGVNHMVQSYGVPAPLSSVEKMPSIESPQQDAQDLAGGRSYQQFAVPSGPQNTMGYNNITYGGVIYNNRQLSGQMPFQMPQQSTGAIAMYPLGMPVFNNAQGTNNTPPNAFDVNHAYYQQRYHSEVDRHSPPYTSSAARPYGGFNEHNNRSNQQNSNAISMAHYRGGMGRIPQYHNGGHQGSVGNQCMYQPNNYSSNRRRQNRANQSISAGNSSGWIPSGGNLQFGGLPSSNPNAGSDFALNLDLIETGNESRTTIMVRNIPNKYNQQMLLEEVNVHHEGSYDFFYLPIDFKNRCNVGYCFINFIDPRSIASFVREFNGQRWKSFNSEKICAVSFARIQGKQAMITRFQNSSLLEKDDEYRPLLFYSSGPDRGKPEPFPSNSTRPRIEQGLVQLNNSSNPSGDFHSSAKIIEETVAPEEEKQQDSEVRKVSERSNPELCNE